MILLKSFPLLLNFIVSITPIGNIQSTFTKVINYLCLLSSQVYIELAASITYAITLTFHTYYSLDNDILSRLTHATS